MWVFGECSATARSDEHTHEYLRTSPWSEAKAITMLCHVTLEDLAYNSRDNIIVACKAFIGQRAAKWFTCAIWKRNEFL
jgi:hypothetical protein